MARTITKTIWENLIVPNMKIHIDDEGNCVGYSCEEFYKMDDQDFQTFLETDVYLEEE